MSKLAGTYNLPNGWQTKVYAGWSWPGFFFGPLYYLYKGMIGKAALWFFASLILWIFALGWIIWIVTGALANKDYNDHLLKSMPTGTFAPLG